MNALDWSIVLIINGGIVLYGLIVFREQGESFDWYLAAKSMPWWVIGLSAFGTAVDSGDYVAVVGGAYEFGLSQLSQWWLGISLGWILLSFFGAKYHPISGFGQPFRYKTRKHHASSLCFVLHRASSRIILHHHEAMEP